MRFSLLSYKMPELGGPNYGCFAKLPKHPPSVGKGFFKTTYQDDFLKRFEDRKFKSITGQILSSTNTFSGLRSNYVSVDKKHITSKLVNEKYNPNKERKYNTEIQRTWTYHRDPAIEAIEDFKIDNASKRPWPKSIKFMTLPMKNNEEYQKMQYQTYIKCGHKISDITRKRLKEMEKEKNIIIMVMCCLKVNI